MQKTKVTSFDTEMNDSDFPFGTLLPEEKKGIHSGNPVVYTTEEDFFTERMSNEEQPFDWEAEYSVPALQTYKKA